MLSHYGINEGSNLHLVLRLKGMISNFNSNNTTNPLISYLLLGDEEHANTSIPIKELCEAHTERGANIFSTFYYDERPDIFHESQLDMLCNLLDFMWERTAKSANDRRIDMKLTMSNVELCIILNMSVVHPKTEKYSPFRLQGIIESLFYRVPSHMSYT
jgi:hypothetical protein